MSTAKTTKISVIVNVILVFAWIVAAIYLSGCATTGVEKPIDAARQKAIQDSLKKIWEFELNKNYSIGAENHKNKMYERALKPLWRVVELDTSYRFKGLYDKLGDSYLQLSKPDSALLVFEKGVQVFPDNAYIRRSLGYLYSAMNQRQNAINNYQKAIEITGKDESKERKPDDYRALGKLLVAEGKIEEAIPVYEQLAKLEPQNQEVQEILATLYRQMGNEEAMIDSWIRALEMDPKNTDLLFRIGKAYFDRGDNQKAQQNFQQLLVIKSDDATALEYLGDTQQNLGSFTEAIKTYEKVIVLRPDNFKVMCDIASCYRELKKYPTARTYANKAAQVNPNVGLPYFVLGEIYEATAEECMAKDGRKEAKFDDRLVFELAYNNFKKAITDLEVGREAVQKVQYLEEFIPKKEHRFMHPNQTRAELSCYSWIY